MRRFNHRFLNVKHAINAFVLFLLVAGCQSDDFEQMSDLTSKAVKFGAVVMNDVDLQTRTLVQNDMEKVPFYMDFYIQLCMDNDDNLSKDPEIGTYVIPSGYSGWLESKEGHQRLNWKDLISDHTFYGWNLPCIAYRDNNQDGQQDQQVQDDWITKEIGGSYEEWVEHEKTSKRISDGDNYPLYPLTIDFYDSEEGEHYNKYRNNEHLENFVGSEAGPVNYRDNGTYVELVFRHLVSKIEINKLSLIDGPHTIVNNLKANMTFFGMPRSATFYPHPTDEQVETLSGLSYNGSKWEGPVVVANTESISEDDALTFFIADDPKSGVDNLFYVCPEIDFSKMVFRIDLNSESYADRQSYYGTFDNVNFVRKKGDDYDEINGGDEKILHAGEVMHLVIELYPGMGPGLSVVIDDWSVDKATGRDAAHHSHPGIYSDSEAQDLVDVFGDEDATREQIDNIYDLYGYPEESSEQKVFKLYENITVSGSKFPIGEDYVLDGLGHTITMSPSNSTVTIGNMRDVYITDGTNTIYIDSEGYVCLYNSETYSYEKTVNKLNGTQTSINLTTGEVS